MENKILACAYTRFSTDNQNQSSTLGQLRSIKSYCEKNNIEIIETYIDEAQSGTNMERINFQRLLKDAPNALWSTVVVYNMSRLSRSVKDTLTIKEEFKRMGKRIVSVIENQDETPEGDFFNLITYGMNELFVKQFKRDSWRGMMTNAIDAKYLGGKIPYGYTITKDKKYMINENEAEIVRFIFNEIINGSSYSEILKKISENETYKKERKIGKTTIEYIIKNERYAGVYLWNVNKRIHNNGHSHSLKNDPSEIIRIKNGIPAIIDSETFNNAQKIIASRKSNKKRPTISKYFLTGLVKCGICGYSFYGYHGFKSNYDVRCYYSCTHKRSTSNCSSSAIHMDYLDNYVCKLVENVILNMKSSNAYKELINNYYDVKKELKDKKIDELNLQIQNLENVKNEYVIKLNIAKDDEYVELTNMIGETSTKISILNEKLNKLKKEFILQINLKKDFIDSRIRMTKKEYIKNKKEEIHRLINQIVVGEKFIETNISLNYLFDIKEDDLIIKIKELRSHFRQYYHYDEINFTIENTIALGADLMIKELKDGLNKI